MINSTQFSMQTDVLEQAQNAGLANNSDDFTSIKRMNPNYIEKWYKEFQRYNGADSEPITTGYRILDCYSVVKENLNTGLRSENITVSLLLAPVPGKIPDNTYLQLKLWGPGVEMVHPYKQKKNPSSSFMSFVQMMTAKFKTPFERYISLTVGNKSGWKELRTHYPDIIATTGIVSFIPTGFYNNAYTYTGYFFEQAKEPGAMPLSSNELINGKHKEQCDFVSFQKILQDAFNAFAGTPAPQSDPTPPTVPAEQSNAVPPAPEGPAEAAPSFGSATAINSSNATDDEIPF